MQKKWLLPSRISNITEDELALRFLRIPAVEDLQDEAEAANLVGILNLEAAVVQDLQIPETEEEEEDPLNLLKVAKADLQEKAEVVKKTLKVQWTEENPDVHKIN